MVPQRRQSDQDRKVAGPLPPPPAGRPNTVGLHTRELHELLDQYDIPDSGKGHAKRDFVRWPFRRASVPMRLIHPGGATSSITVACRNISRGGMGVLHSSYLHPGTRISVTLPHPEHGNVKVDGWITRCQHRAGIVHELGICFAEPIDVRDLLRPDPLADHFSLERVKPEDLDGSVLCVDESEMDQRIVRHFLRSTRIRLRCVESAAAAMTLLGEVWDVILIDYDLRDQNGADLVRAMRDCGIGSPILVMTCDTSASMRRKLSTVDAHAFLAKPLSQHLLLRALAEFLVAGRGGSSVQASTLPADHPDTHLVEGFVQSLRATARKLEDGIRRNDAAGCRTTCMQLAGSAPAVGFQQIAHMAAEAAQLLSRTASIAQSIRPLRALIAACERARPPGTAAA